MNVLPFVADGHHATSVTQCPHSPDAPEWRAWQVQFMDGQLRGPDDRPSERYLAEADRIGKLKDERDARLGPSSETIRVDALIAEMEMVTATCTGPSTLHGKFHSGGPVATNRAIRPIIDEVIAVSYAQFSAAIRTLSSFKFRHEPQTWEQAISLASDIPHFKGDT